MACSFLFLKSFCKIILTEKLALDHFYLSVQFDFTTYLFHRKSIYSKYGINAERIVYICFLDYRISFILDSMKMML